MIRFHTIQSHRDPHWEALIETYRASFPIDEQRPIESIIALMGKKSQFTVSALTDEKDAFVGLLTSWKFDSFVYIEHFAICPTLRSSGYGTQTLKAFVESCTLPVVLEVEPPTDEMTRKRIQFYQRNGFTVYDYEYYQPPYTPDLQGVVLRLMATVPENKDFATIVAHTLHSVVYGVKK